MVTVVGAKAILAVVQAHSLQLELVAIIPVRTGGTVVVCHRVLSNGRSEFPVWKWNPSAQALDSGNYCPDEQTAMSTALVRAGWA